MLLSIVWMFVQDYDREYKDEQRQFRDVEDGHGPAASCWTRSPRTSFEQGREDGQGGQGGSRRRKQVRTRSQCEAR